MMRVEEFFGPQGVRIVAAVYFALMILWQLWPLIATQRGMYGHRLHPANRLYSVFAGIGILGTFLMMLVFYGTNSVVMVASAGALMFLGIVGAGVLAFFATPWRDWTFRHVEKGKDGRSRVYTEFTDGWDEEPVEDIWDTQFK